MKRMAIFHIYDKDGIIGDYIFYLLDDLLKNINYLIVVCNGKITDNDINKIKIYADDFFIRDNIGFDFGAYKDVLENLLDREKLLTYNEIIFMNDTCFGPLYPLKIIFDDMEKRNVDLWGITEGVPAEAPHLKSGYQHQLMGNFLAVREKIICDSCFIEFWDERNMPQTKKEAVVNYEMKFAAYFEAKGFKCASYIEYIEGMDMYSNPYGTIKDMKVPFIKKRVFNQLYRTQLAKRYEDSLVMALKYIKEKTIYDVNMIWDHIIRVCDITHLYNLLQLNYMISKSKYNNQIYKNRVGIVYNDESISEASKFIEVFEKYIQKYEFICYMPWCDKDNVLANNEYIENIINCFEDNENLGILMCLDIKNHLYNEEQEDLVRIIPFIDSFVKLNKINCVYSVDSKRIGSGLAFWFRAAALNGLAEYNFQNKDIISNRILEWILILVAQHKGYYTGSIMTNEQAASSLIAHKYVLNELQRMRYLKKNKAYHELLLYDLITIKDLCKIKKKIYIYGAGNYGKKCYDYCHEYMDTFIGFIVSDGHRINNSAIIKKGFIIYELSEISPADDIGIIVAINLDWIAEIISYLAKKGFDNVISFINIDL